MNRRFACTKTCGRWTGTNRKRKTPGITNSSMGSPSLSVSHGKIFQRIKTEKGFPFAKAVSAEMKRSSPEQFQHFHIAPGSGWNNLGPREEPCYRIHGGPFAGNATTREAGGAWRFTVECCCRGSRRIQCITTGVPFCSLFTRFRGNLRGFYGCIVCGRFQVFWMGILFGRVYLHDIWSWMSWLKILICVCEMFHAALILYERPICS